MKWKIEAILVSISTTNSSKVEASDYKVTVVTPIIEESGVDTIFIEAAYNYWSGGDRKVEAKLGCHLIDAGTYDEISMSYYVFVVLTKAAVQLMG